MNEKQAERIREWISVKERLPDQEAPVLVIDVNYFIYQCCRINDKWHYFDGEFDTLMKIPKNITHWSKSPKPPKD